MVWLGGPRGGGRTKPIVLHDPPPGYQPPKRPPWHLLVNERHAVVLVRVGVVILYLAGVSVLVFIAMMIAGYR
jgi:hypothetical protein